MYMFIVLNLLYYLMSCNCYTVVKFCVIVAQLILYIKCNMIENSLSDKQISMFIYVHMYIYTMCVIKQEFTLHE